VLTGCTYSRLSPWDYIWTKILIWWKKRVPGQFWKRFGAIDSWEPGEGTSSGHIIRKNFENFFYAPLFYNLSYPEFDENQNQYDSWVRGCKWYSLWACKRRLRSLKFLARLCMENSWLTLCIRIDLFYNGFLARKFCQNQLKWLRIKFLRSLNAEFSILHLFNQ